MLAGALKIPELALDEKESRTIADATAKVASFYDVVAEPKTIAWANLAMTLGMVYGTRFVAISMRRKDERRKRAQSNVTPIQRGVVDSSIAPDGKMPPFEPPITRQ